MSFLSSSVRAAVGASLAAITLAAAANTVSDTVAADALAQVLAGEIAQQRQLLPQAWKNFMAAAKTTRDPQLAERAWESALESRNPETAALALRLWRELAPEDPRTEIYSAAEGLLSSNAKTRADSETRLNKALARTEGPNLVIAKIMDLTATAENKRAVYESLNRLSAPYLKDYTPLEMMLAQNADNAGLKQEAVRHAENALNAAPDDLPLLMIGTDYLLHAKPQAATDHLKRFVSAHPEAAMARLSLARSYLSTGTDEDIERELAELNRRHGSDAEVVFAAGTIAEEAGLLDEAERAYKKFLVLIHRPGNKRLEPDDAYARLGMVKLARGDKIHAVEWFHKVEKGGRYLAVKLKEAQVLADLGETDAACTVLKNTRADAKQRGRLLLAVADLYLQAGRAEEAYQAGRDAQTLLPNNPQTIYKGAQLAEHTQRFDEAEFLLRHYIVLRPNDANGHNALGYLWLEHDKNLSEAAQHIERAMALSNGRDGFITDSMGWLRFKEGRFEEAETYLRKAFQMQPDLDIALHLAEVLLVNGRTGDAERLLNLVLKNAPENPTAQRLHQRLQSLSRKQGGAP